MRVGDADGRPVIDLGTATTVSEVTGFAVDRELNKVVGVRLGKRRKAVWIAWSKLAAFGPDAVTVPDRAVFDDAPGDIPEGSVSLSDGVIGRLVLTDGGDEAGVVVDVEFDPATAEVQAVFIDGQPLSPSGVVAVGDYAVVVRAEQTAGNG